MTCILLLILIFSCVFWKAEPYINRSSRPQVFCKKSALKNFVTFTGKYTCRSLFFDKVIGSKSETLLERDSSTGVSLWILQKFSEYLVRLFFSVIGAQYWPSTPWFLSFPKNAFFLDYMFVMEFIFDKAGILWWSYRMWISRKLEGDRLCNLTNKELHHELFVENVSKFHKVIISLPLANLKYCHLE